MSDSKRKITVVHIITKLEMGGAQQNTLYTVEHLDRGKFDAVLITGTDGHLVQQALDLKNVDLYLIDDLVREINPFKDYRALKKIRKILADKSEAVGKEKIIVHTHSSKAGILGRWAARNCKIPVIIHTFHGFGFNDYQNFFKKNSYVFIERETAKISTALVAVSEANLKKALNLGIGKEEQFHLIRSGIKLEDYFENPLSAEEARESLSLPLDIPLIGSVACFKPQKDLLTFVRAAREICNVIPEAGFVLAGDGEMRAEIEDEIKKHSLKDNFILLGWTENTSVFLRAIDLLLHTALWEGLPRVLAEAVATGIPVVAADVDGNSEVVTDGGNGFLAAPGDYIDMAKKVCRILNDLNLAENLSKNQSLIDDSFHIDTMVKMQEYLYLSFFE